MTPETPIAEVARYLPRRSAQVLMNEPIEIQTAVLENVRTVLMYWEAADRQLDPIALDTALSGFVPVLIGLLSATHNHLRALSSQLAAADILIESLGQSLAQIAQEARE